jgi:hypothetical protein
LLSIIKIILMIYEKIKNKFFFLYHILSKKLKRLMSFMIIL